MGGIEHSVFYFLLQMRNKTTLLANAFQDAELVCETEQTSTSGSVSGL